jgi:catechol 2,3-dioxygenase-like lactoylglutathione lyase family enzyme
MKIAGVLETCLYTPDLEAAKAFYQGILGLSLFAEQPGRHLFFRAGPGVFLLFNPEATQQETVLPPHGARGSAHVCFRVPEEELPYWAEKLKAHGFQVTWAEWKAGRSIYVRDPADNLVELAPAAIWGFAEGLENVV